MYKFSNEVSKRSTPMSSSENNNDGLMLKDQLKKRKNSERESKRERKQL